MSARTDRAARTTAALAVAALVNGGLLSLLLLDSARRAAFAPPAPSPDIRIELARRPAGLSPSTGRPLRDGVTRAVSSREHSRAERAPSAETAPVRGEPQPERAAPPAAAPPAAPQALGSSEAGEAAAASRAATALLQRLQDCSGRASAERELQAKCAGSRDGAASAGLSPDRRAEFGSAAGRAAEQMETAARLQRNTFAPPLDGSVARFGCVFSGGKRRCGSY